MTIETPFDADLGSARTGGVVESVIREMTREANRHGAINLSQGLPDESETPPEVIAAAREAVGAGNQYSVTWGLRELREAVSERYAEWKGVRYDPETEVTITCGTSEAIMSSMLALCDPGDGVIYFEPTYENYIPSVRFAGGEPIPIDLGDSLAVDADALKRAATEASILVLNTPHNPTGKVFSPEELRLIADVAADEDLILLTDEIYEHIVYDDAYRSPVEIDGLAERSVVCTGLSKTFAVTGWRVGFALAPAALSKRLRTVHDYTSICAPTPFQRAGIEALSLPEEYFTDLSDSYRARRDLMVEGLREVGLDPVVPDGSYYVVARYDTGEDDTAFSKRLTREAGVAPVPGSSFYTEGTADWIRFTFARNEETIGRALDRLAEHRWW